MRAQEFIVERDEWVHMDPPEVARWREQARVQGIMSGPESTLSTTQPNKTGPRYTIPDVPWTPAKPDVSPEKPKATGRRYTPPDERDEYWAASPQSKGGKVPIIKRLTPTRDVEMNADASKGKDWFDPKEQKAKRQDNLTANPAIPSIEKEKNRT